MDIGIIVTLGVALVVIVYFVMIYNNLVQIKHNVTKAWANIDVLLKQRHDELPKLVETCKQYMKFEQDTLTKVMEARSRVSSARETQNIGALGQAEGVLRGALVCVFMCMNRYCGAPVTVTTSFGLTVIFTGTALAGPQLPAASLAST